MSQYKTCSKCKQTQSITEFHKQAKSKDGLQTQCKKCKRISNRSYMSDWRSNNGQLHRDRNKKYRNANPKKTQMQRAARYQRNKNQENESARNYYRKNPDKIRELASLRKRRSQSSGIFYVSRKELQKLYSSKCYFCSSSNRIEIDHIVPISKGGRHSIGNLAPLCRSCNRSKSDKLLIEFKILRRNNG